MNSKVYFILLLRVFIKAVGLLFVYLINLWIEYHPAESNILNNNETFDSLHSCFTMNNCVLMIIGCPRTSWFGSVSGFIFNSIHWNILWLLVFEQYHFPTIPTIHYSFHLPYFPVASHFYKLEIFRSAIKLSIQLQLIQI